MDDEMNDEGGGVVDQQVRNGMVSRCYEHSVFYDTASGCPFCKGEPERETLAPEPRARHKGVASKCRYCGAGTIYPDGVCSKYPCLTRAGLNAQHEPRPVFGKCAQCGGRARNGDLCSAFRCWKKAGRSKEWRDKYHQS